MTVAAVSTDSTPGVSNNNIKYVFNYFLTSLSLCRPSVHRVSNHVNPLIK